MKKSYLENLPTKKGLGVNVNKDVIDWENSIGLTFYFEYHNICGYMLILGYNPKNKKVKVQYNGETYDILSATIRGCNLGKKLGIISKNHKFKVGDIYKNLLINETFISEIYYDSGYKNVKKYRYKCIKCGYEDEITETHLVDKKRKGCPSCSNKKVTPQNCIWNTNKWMCDLGVSEEDAKTHTYGSDDEIIVKCPHCGKCRRKRISDIYNKKSIGCKVCGDGVSYPEKIMTDVLNQSNLYFETEIKPKWANGRLYDFYIPSLNMIIETHGLQHYENSNRGRTLKEEQDNDKIKRELALTNGIDTYIEIDCRYSELDWIKNSILNSELFNCIELDKIDWMKCEEFALYNNLLVSICEYWKNKQYWETTKDLGNIFNISRHNISKKLVKGAKIGLCEYNPKDECGFKIPVILCIDENRYYFKSKSELHRKVKEMFGFNISNEFINKSLNDNITKEVGGKIIKVIYYYNQYIENQN